MTRSALTIESHPRPDSPIELSFHRLFGKKTKKTSAHSFSSTSLGEPAATALTLTTSLSRSLLLPKTSAVSIPTFT